MITVKRAKRCLLDAGYSYSCESILQSEMRVLKTLSFNVSRTSCLDFIEILLEILGKYFLSLDYLYPGIVSLTTVDKIFICIFSLVNVK